MPMLMRILMSSGMRGSRDREIWFTRAMKSLPKDLDGDGLLQGIWYERGTEVTVRTQRPNCCNGNGSGALFWMDVSIEQSADIMRQHIWE